MGSAFDYIRAAQHLESRQGLGARRGVVDDGLRIRSAEPHSRGREHVARRLPRGVQKLDRQPGQRPVRLLPSSVQELLDIFDREGAHEIDEALKAAWDELQRSTP